MYCKPASPEAAHRDEGHKPQPQVGPGHEQDVVRMVHCVQVPVSGVKHRLVKPVLTTVHLYCVLSPAAPRWPWRSRERRGRPGRRSHPPPPSSASQRCCLDSEIIHTSQCFLLFSHPLMLLTVYNKALHSRNHTDKIALNQ